jgi:hypothetical protein
MPYVSFSMSHDRGDDYSDIPDGPIGVRDSFLHAREQLAYEQGRNDFMFLPPLAWLLYRMNAPGVALADRDACARAVLPYCHEKVPEQQVALGPDPQFDFGPLNSARDILRAQKRVMRALGAGTIGSALAARHIAMLDALRRSYEAVETENRLLDYEETRKSVEAALDPEVRS